MWKIWKKFFLHSFYTKTRLKKRWPFLGFFGYFIAPPPKKKKKKKKITPWKISNKSLPKNKVHSLLKKQREFANEHPPLRMWRILFQRNHYWKISGYPKIEQHVLLLKLCAIKQVVHWSEHFSPPSNETRGSLFLKGIITEKWSEPQNLTTLFIAETFTNKACGKNLPRVSLLKFSAIKQLFKFWGQINEIWEGGYEKCSGQEKTVQ